MITSASIAATTVRHIPADLRATDEVLAAFAWRYGGGDSPSVDLFALLVDVAVVQARACLDEGGSVQDPAAVVRDLVAGLGENLADALDAGVFAR